MDDHNTLRRMAEAFDFAARAHAHQKRKGQAAEPYINHLADVAARLARSPRADVETVIAGLLHDVVEDTGRTIEEVEASFGPTVAGYVREVTDDKSLPKEERKRRQVETAARKSDGAKRIKLADKASNLAALAQSPPHLWDSARKKAYVEWAHEVVAGLRGVDPFLEVAFDEEAARAADLYKV